MNEERVGKIMVVAAVSSALLFVYAESLGEVITRGNYPRNGFETAILVIQLAKLLAIFTIPRLRRATPSVIFDIFGIEILFLPVFALLYIWLGYPPLLMVLLYVYPTWPVAAMVVLPLYTIYSSAKGMLKSERLSTILPSVSVQFGLLLLFWNAATIAGPGGGFVGLFRSMATALVTTGASASGHAISAPGGELVAAVLLYLGLMGYAIFDRQSKPVANLAGVLALAVVGTLLETGWTALLVSLTRVALLVLLAPTLGMLGLLWWFSRGR